MIGPTDLLHPSPARTGLKYALASTNIEKNEACEYCCFPQGK